MDGLKEVGAIPALFKGDPTGAVAVIKMLDDGTLEAIADPRKGHATAKVSAGIAFPIAGEYQ